MKKSSAQLDEKSHLQELQKLVSQYCEGADLLKDLRDMRDEDFKDEEHGQKYL